MNFPIPHPWREKLQQLWALLWHQADAPSASFHIGCRWFIATVSLSFGIAFLSLWLQLDGLFGAHGLSPIRDLMFHARMTAGAQQVLMNPTLFWLDTSDGLLHAVCGLGVIFSIATGIGWIRGPGLLLLWAGYLSFCSVGAPFLNFQWDNLLLEAGLISVFLISWRSWKPVHPVFHPLVRWLGVYLLFRLMLASGIVKLSSGDPVWASLAALDYHFFTQPLPAPPAWWMHQLPELLRVLSTAGMFVIELLIPFCFFLPRRLRLLGAGTTILLQIAIMLTGNYGFFNLLTIGLCCLLIDDAAWATLSRGWMKYQETSIFKRVHASRMIWHGSVLAFTFTILGMTTVQWFGVFRLAAPLPEALKPLYAIVSGSRSINSYGLFATMTTHRSELIIEGSNDGITWKTYRFPWKPDAVEDGLPLVAPHMPRVDWQLWFAALTPPQSARNRWLQRFCGKLLVGNPQVLGLLEENPFPESPPQWIRIRAAEFTFTNRSERQESGNVWKAGPDRIYWPPMQLTD
ncbi:MAG: lipase maturation factor family protein [Verrucomicrobiota bacterium]